MGPTLVQVDPSCLLLEAVALPNLRVVDDFRPLPTLQLDLLVLSVVVPIHLVALPTLLVWEETLHRLRREVVADYPIHRSRILVGPSPLP